MGQKANPNSLVIGLKKNWKTEFSERKKRDLGVVFSKDYQILNFIERILYLNGFTLQDFRIHHLDSTIVLFLSIQAFNYDYSRTRSKESLSKCLIVHNKSKSALELPLGPYYGNTKPTHLLSQKIAESLASFAGRRIKISLSLANSYINLNKSAKTEVKKNILALRKHSKYSFNFFESLYVSDAVSKNPDFAGALINLVIPVLAKSGRIKPFFRFLKRVLALFIENSNSSVYGIKIKVKGRVNGARRARTLRLVVGDVACHSHKLNLNYVSKTTHNSNGSYGLKVWVVGP